MGETMMRPSFTAAALLTSLALAGCTPSDPPADTAGDVSEYAIHYPGEPNPPAPGHGVHAPGGAPHPGSTHEIAYDEASGALWISGQNHDSLARVTLGPDGRPRIGFQELAPGSGPHGIAFDAAGRRWVTLEFLGRIVAFDRAGRQVADYDVRLNCATARRRSTAIRTASASAPTGRRSGSPARQPGRSAGSAPTARSRPSPCRPRAARRSISGPGRTGTCGSPSSRATRSRG